MEFLEVEKVSYRVIFPIISVGVSILLLFLLLLFDN